MTDIMCSNIACVHNDRQDFFSMCLLNEVHLTINISKAGLLQCYDFETEEEK